MSNPSFRLPEPNLPEHRLLREAGPLPQLSSELRDRVLTDCGRQVRYGRWVDRLRITGAVLVASLMVALVWNFRWTSENDHTKPAPDLVNSPAGQTTFPPTRTSAGADPSADANSRRTLPQGGPASRPEMKEMQQINQLIDDLNNRNHTLCSFLPIW